MPVLALVASIALTVWTKPADSVVRITINNFNRPDSEASGFVTLDGHVMTRLRELEHAHGAVVHYGGDVFLATGVISPPECRLRRARRRLGR